MIFSVTTITVTGITIQNYSSNKKLASLFKRTTNYFLTFVIVQRCSFSVKRANRTKDILKGVYYALVLTI